MTTRALVTGCTGQDGSYLCELLLSKGYEVHGIIRRSSNFNTQRIDHLFSDLILHYGDMTDGSALGNIINDVMPDEIYHLAAQSHVKVSFELPEYTGNADALGTLRILETVRSNKRLKQTRIYNACTSEMFGSAPAPQTENTPFMPCSPYGTAKLYSYWIAKNYRQSYNIFVSNGILFNHESPRRGNTFVTKKIVRAAVAIKNGLQKDLPLGNITSRRDWGHARDFVDGMWRMLQHHEPDDFVLATGKSHTVHEFGEMVFDYLGLRFEDYVKYDSSQERPNEVYNLQGSYDKAYKALGWKPTCNINDLVKEMVDYEIQSSDK